GCGQAPRAGPAKRPAGPPLGRRASPTQRRSRTRPARRSHPGRYRRASLRDRIRRAQWFARATDPQAAPAPARAAPRSPATAGGLTGTFGRTPGAEAKSPTRMTTMTAAPDANSESLAESSLSLAFASLPQAVPLA